MRVHSCGVCGVCVCACQASPVHITGATGPNASLVNGVYTPVPGEVYNGHPIFVKAGEPDKYLRYKPNHCWGVSGTASKDANNTSGWAYSVEKHVGLPQDVKRWKVCVNDEWEVQPGVRVATVTLQVRALFVCI